jgi:uncharacterized delta-60 repeat protein
MKNLIYFLFTCYCYSQSGSFDTTFDGDGKAFYCFPLGQSYSPLDASFQSTGKIIVYSNNYDVVGASVLRWNTNGTIDTTFGVNGFVNFTQTVPFINGGHFPYRMTVQPDDKIIIMGLQQNNTYPNAYWIARLLPNGALDTSFNGTGYRDLSFGTIQDRGTCISLQADGKILLGGTSGDTGEFFTLARLNSNGTLDISFGNNGKAQISFSGNESFVQSMEVQNDGKIILGGYTVSTTKDFALARLNNNGTLDTSFGTNGKVITTLNSSYSDLITDLIIEPDGKIIAGGFTSSENNPLMCMVRYLSNGTIDTSFGTNGIVINNDDNSRSCTLVRQIDGKIIMGGCYDGLFFLTIRYNNDGTKDSSFGTNGVVNLFPDTYGYATKALIQSDNKIVVCGSTNSPDFSQVCFTIIRLNPGTLEVNDFDRANMQVYPNPTIGIVSFDNSEKQYEKVSVYNCLGQLILQPFYFYPGTTTIDLSGFARGVFLIKFEGNGRDDFAKVIKE